jgi:RNA polymerase sigma-70 factor (ECF subfamily)
VTDRSDDRSQIVEALRRRDVGVFRQLLDREYPATLRLASLLNEQRARELARGAWLQLLEVDNIDDAPTVRAWLLQRVLEQEEPVDEEVAAEPQPSLFRDDDDLWAGGWIDPVAAWPEAADTDAARSLIESVLTRLAPVVAATVVLRDVEGLSSLEVEAVLDLDDEAQRVLLHEGRTAIRDALAGSFEGAAT